MEINPNLHLILQTTGLAQLAAGLTDDAVRTFSRLTDVAPWFPTRWGCLAAAYVDAGEADRARELSRRFRGAKDLNFGHAVYYAVAGETESMFEALEGCFEQREYFLPRIRRVPFFDPYLSDPRFQSLLRRMNFA